MEKDICETCKIYTDKKKELLIKCDSAFGAAAEMWYFIKDCKKTCNKQNKGKTNEKSSI